MVDSLIELLRDPIWQGITGLISVASASIAVWAVVRGHSGGGGKGKPGHSGTGIDEDETTYHPVPAASRAAVPANQSTHPMPAGVLLAWMRRITSARALHGGALAALLAFLAGLAFLVGVVDGRNAAPFLVDIFHDTLYFDRNGWPSDSHCRFQSDGYHISGGYKCGPDPYLLGPQTDAIIQVTVKQSSGPPSGDASSGIAFRRAEPDAYYGFEISADGRWTFYKTIPGQPDVVIRKFMRNPAIRSGLGVENTLEVRCKGPQFDFVVNGANVGSYDDHTYSSGYIALIGEHGIEVVFTKFNVLLEKDHADATLGPLGPFMLSHPGGENPDIDVWLLLRTLLVSVATFASLAVWVAQIWPSRVMSTIARRARKGRGPGAGSE